MNAIAVISVSFRVFRRKNKTDAWVCVGFPVGLRESSWISVGLRESSWISVDLRSSLTVEYNVDNMSALSCSGSLSAGADSAVPDYARAPLLSSC